VQNYPCGFEPTTINDWRIDLYDETAENFDEATRSGGIDAACEFSNQMLRNLERAVDHPDMTPELAELLSTANVAVEHRIETDIKID
jgi:hypothetical protein